MELDKNKIKTESESLAFCIKTARQIDKIELKENKSRVAILSNFTLRGLDSCLKVKSFCSDISIETYMGEYGQWQQELLKDDLYAFNPDLVFVILDLVGISDDLWHSYHLLSKEEMEARKLKVLEDISSVLSVAKTKTKAKIVLSTSPCPSKKIIGIADNKHGHGLKRFVDDLNRDVENLYFNDNQVLIFDFDSWLSYVGKQSVWYTKYLFLGDMRLSPDGVPLLAEELVSFLVPLVGKTKKCIVLDLDNTLWGGVIGEDGMSGIQLDPTGAGQQFYCFQQLLLGLNKRGVILAVNSKNNPEDAYQVFDQHPYMLLKRENFAAMQINWNNKAANMKMLADEIGIGLDSMLFIDDDPTNRALIRDSMPEVDVLDLPEDSSAYMSTLLNYKGFNAFTLTDEDKNRSEMYESEKKRKEFKAEAVDINGFLKGLNIHVNIQVIDEFLALRCSQLTQKTNQFNLTTKRYQEEDIHSFMSSGDLLWMIGIKDNYGEYGNTGVVIVKNKGGFWEIDTFLMSCRVLGKRIEEQFLGFVLNELKMIDEKKVVGKYIATKKNVQTKDFYEKLGFCKEGEADGESVWELDLKVYEFSPINFIEID